MPPRTPIGGGGGGGEGGLQCPPNPQLCCVVPMALHFCLWQKLCPFLFIRMLPYILDYFLCIENLKERSTVLCAFLMSCIWDVCLTHIEFSRIMWKAMHRIGHLRLEASQNIFPFFHYLNFLQLVSLILKSK